MSILLDLQIIVEVDGYKTVNDQVPEFVGEKREYKRAYLKGAFIASGSISDPERTYHMEFVVQDESFGDSLLELLHAFDVPAKMILRKNSYVIYLKDSEHIITTLNIIGAHNALLAIENVKIVKGMRNKVNRVVNCETANLSKTVAASYRQVACIEKIKAKGLYERLPADLQQLAQLRLHHQEASLKELGQMMRPNMGKSAVNHRLKKLMEWAEED